MSEERTFGMRNFWIGSIDEYLSDFKAFEEAYPEEAKVMEGYRLLHDFALEHDCEIKKVYNDDKYNIQIIMKPKFFDINMLSKPTCVDCDLYNFYEGHCYQHGCRRDEFSFKICLKFKPRFN